MQVKPLAAPQVASGEVTEGVALGPLEVDDTEAADLETLAEAEAADDDTWLPHFPNPAWQPVPQCPAVLPQ